MISFLLQCVVCLLALCLHASAFWWAPPSPPQQPSTTTTTTTTESPLTLKQIPLTYFRTYTYQPLVNNPLSNAFGYPFYSGAAAMPAPLLHPGARYEHFMPNYPFQRPSTGLYPNRGDEPVLHPKPFGSAMAMAPPTGTTTTTAATTKPTTTTTTTTTTPPPPPTTTTTTSTSTTTSTTAAPAPPPPSAALLDAPMAPVIAQRMTPFGSTSYPYPYPYPTYNRRAYVSSYNPQLYRQQQYPYPEYTLYKAPTQNSATRIAGAPQQLQFVPCMCPVSVGGLPPGVGAAALNTNMVAYAPQGRTTGDTVDGELNDSEMALPAEDAETQAKAETEMGTDGKQKSKIVIEAEPVDLQRSAAKSFMLLGEPLDTNKLDEDAKLQTQTQVRESEAEV